jgi:hypothetical protein
VGLTNFGFPLTGLGPNLWEPLGEEKRRGEKSNQRVSSNYNGCLAGAGEWPDADERRFSLADKATIATETGLSPFSTLPGS